MPTLLHACPVSTVSQWYGNEFSGNLSGVYYARVYAQAFGLAHGHPGIDYGVAPGTPVRAMAAGTIVFAGWGANYHSTVGGGSYTVVIDHGSYRTAYLHLTAGSQKFAVGTKVAQGEVIALSGNTGQSTGPHCHTQYMPDPFAPNDGYWGTRNHKSYLIPALKLKATQREVGLTAAVAQRSAPATNAKVTAWLSPGGAYTFKGWVRGEKVSGNDIWFVGANSGDYVWSGGFTNAKTTGLPDLNPKAAPKPAAGQRQTADAVVNVRATSTTAGKLLRQLQPGTITSPKAWARGDKVTQGGVASDVWFQLDGGWGWAGGFTSQSTSGIPAYTPPKPEPEPEPKPDPEPSPEPLPTPKPEPVPAYSFAADLPCVTEVIPARVGHFQAGGLPAKPAGAVWHQFNAGERPQDHHIDEVISWFRDPANDQFTASHFVIEGKRIIQMVKLGDRAYHAGPKGNDLVGVEVYGGMDADTIASMRLVARQLDEHYGYKLVPHRHSEFMATPCGKDVDLAVLEPVAAVPDLPTGPPTVPAEPPAGDVLDQFFKWLRESFAARKK